MSIATEDERFCDACGVVLELHPWPEEHDPAERGCDIAGRKADLLAGFLKVFS